MKNLKGKKEKIRDQIIERRKNLSSDEKSQWDASIAKNLMNLPIWRAAKTVCIYVSIPNEVDTRRLILSLSEQRKTIIMPHIDGETITLRTFSSINNLTAGMLGVLQPRDETLIVPVDLVDLFIVPGVAFDRNGNRLGRGKGYYDRLLVGVTAPKIGIAYSFQLVAEVPHTSYDVPMTTVITEDAVLTCHPELVSGSPKGFRVKPGMTD